MDDPKNNGRTLWEMLTQRGKPTAALVPFLNPLGHLINSPVAVSFVNGPEFDGYDFTVKKIREAVRRIGDACHRRSAAGSRQARGGERARSGAGAAGTHGQPV